MKKLIIHAFDGDENPRGFEIQIGNNAITYSGCGTVHLERDAAGRRRLIIEWNNPDAAVPDMVAAELNMLWMPVPTPFMREQLLALSERVSLLEARQHRTPVVKAGGQEDKGPFVYSDKPPFFYKRVTCYGCGSPFAVEAGSGVFRCPACMRDR